MCTWDALNQRECKPNEIVITEYREMFESRICAGATEKLPGWENLKNGCVVLRHGTMCSKVHREIL